MDSRFWEHADRLVAGSTIVIDRPKGAEHPRYPNSAYPMDYGYLDGTTTGDGSGIDVWRGSLPGVRVTAAIITVDLLKRDSEVKLLVGCTAEEADRALAAHETGSQAALLVLRPSEREEEFSTPRERETQFTVEIQELQPQTVAGIRAIATQAEIGATFRELLPEIVEYLREIGVAAVGAPYARYFHVGADRVDMEVGIAIERPIDGNARVEPGELPGGEAATTVHVGPYDGLTEAYDALVMWIEQAGRVRSGLPWEVYAMDPEQVPEPDEWRTQIFWPLL